MCITTTTDDGSSAQNHGQQQQQQHVRLQRCYRSIMESLPDMKNVARFISKYAPCFWCKGLSFQAILCRGRVTNAVDHIALTDREVLLRLNALCMIFAAGQVVFGMLLCLSYLIYPKCEAKECARNYIPNLWNPINAVLGLTVFGFALFVTATRAIKIISRVNLLGALVYYWILQYIAPLEALLVFNLFDYVKVTRVFVKHWWDTFSFSYFRELFCPNTNVTEYFVQGINITSDDFCKCSSAELIYFDDCEEVREESENNMNFYLTIFLTINFAWGLAFLITIAPTLHMLESIVSSNIVQKSKERYLHIWLILPTAVCFFTGTSLVGYDDQTSETLTWSAVTVTYVLSGAAFLLVSILGMYISCTTVLDSGSKKRKEHASILFVATSFMTLISVFVILIISVIYSTTIIDFDIGEDRRGSLACGQDFTGCTNCDAARDRDKCPEWSTEDVRRVFVASFKQSVILSTILILYASETLGFGLKLQKRVSNYQIDYV